MDKLPVRKIKFAQALYAGKTRTAAALAAGCKRGPGLHTQASRLAADPAVQAELARLRGKTERRLILERAEALQILTAHARRIRKAAASIQAIDRMAKLEGWNAAERHEVIHGLKPVEAMSHAELEAEARTLGILPAAKTKPDE